MQTGTASIRFERPPRILQAASVVGPKEAEGPLGPLFDEVDPDGACGQDNWEQAESELQKRAAKKVLEKAHLSPKQIRYVLAGDLLGQCIASSFGISELNCPTIGMYGACSTMGLTLATGAMLVNADYADHVLCVTSSHYSSAERQFRFPSDYGNQRPLSAEWTVTGAGAVVLESVQAHTTTQLDLPLAKITGITTGKIVDYGITDSMNMGAAMAPAACDTIAQHFEDFKTKPSDYDKIITGDLSQIGSKLLIDLLREKQIDISDRHMDCGLEIFERKEQDVHAGGSGCGCSAVTLAAYILPQIQKKIWKRVLFVPTGALLSKISFNEGASIPGIAHAVVIESLDSIDTSFTKRRQLMQDYLIAFVVGGVICALSQLLMDKTKLMPGRVMVILVVTGVFLGAFGIYEPFKEWAGAGASVPLLGFGNTLWKGVKKAVDEEGLLGIFKGGLTASSAGICAAMVFGYLASLLSHPKLKKIK